MTCKLPTRRDGNTVTYRRPDVVKEKFKIGLEQVWLLGADIMAEGIWEIIKNLPLGQVQVSGATYMNERGREEHFQLMKS
jgi:hypothetical protein